MQQCSLQSEDKTLYLKDRKKHNKHDSRCTSQTVIIVGKKESDTAYSRQNPEICRENMLENFKMNSARARESESE
jgi:hypothetical protein